jgi:ankyrin repeat protein
MNSEKYPMDKLQFLSRCMVAASCGLAYGLFTSTGASANVRICQELEQQYEQIKSSADTLQINATLGAAADKGCVSLARRLLDDGASLASRNREGSTPLSRAAKSRHADVIELFLARGASINARDLDGSTALFVASEQDSLPIVQLLIAHGSNVNLPGRSGLTAIEAAAYMGNESIVRLLLDKGADPRDVDTTGKSPICYAVGRGYAKVVRVLLDHSVNVNTRYGNDLTALMWAAGHEDGAGTSNVADVIELLIARGAHLDDQDNRGRTALMIAASLGHEKAIDVLLAHGADRTIRDKEQKTAADLAATDDLRKKLAAN